MKLLKTDNAWLDDLPTDDEVVAAILAVPVHFVFTPKSAKNAVVRYGNTGSVPVPAKRWTVTPEVESEADVTNFEGTDVAGLRCVQKLACTIHCTFEIELDMDSANLLYTGGSILPGNSTTELRLYINTSAGPYWSFPTPFFKSVPMTAEVKQALTARITGEGSASFVFPIGNTF